MKGWDGYALTLFGVAVPALPGPTDEWPAWQFQLGGDFDGQVLTIRVDAQAAYRPGVALYAKAAWSQKTGLVKSLEVISDDWDDDDLKMAGYALKRLHGRVPGHGRHGWKDDPDTSWLLLVDQAEDLKHRRPGLNWKDVALNIGLPDRTLREYRRRKRRIQRA
jgi:hypothetical protein